MSIFIGSQKCKIVNPITDTRVDCVLPPGRTLNNQIIMIQGSGRLFVSDPTINFVSYSQCLPGQFDPPVNPDFNCSTCAPGFFSASMGLPVCTVCPPGYVGVQAGQTACSSCPAGSMWLNSGKCQACAPGSAQPANASTTCLPCDVGKYNPFHGQSSCKPTLPGFFSLAGATISTICDPGRFSFAALASSCTACGLNTFSSLVGSTLCQACPAFSTSDPGQATCQCAPDFYTPKAGYNFSCAKCPIGALCIDSSATRFSSVLMSQPGYWRVPDGSSNSLIFMPCPFGLAACPSSFNGSCGVGFKGVLCGTCALGFHNSGQTCVECVGTTKYAIVIVVIVATLAFALLYWVSLKLDTTKFVNGAKVAVSCTRLIQTELSNLIHLFCLFTFVGGYTFGELL